MLGIVVLGMLRKLQLFKLSGICPCFSKPPKYIWIHQLPKSVGKLVVEKDGQFRITFKITSIIVATTLLQSPKTTQEGQGICKNKWSMLQTEPVLRVLVGIDLQSSGNKGNGANKLWQHKKTQNHHENRHFSTRRHPKFL